MRLTLRTLLAYLDDTLPPDQAREIGQKVAESHVAQELMERIKKVTRRRGLTVPPAAGPERIDANTVAEYLDNDLPSDKVAEVEEMALNSDVHLAEISACHQILTLVLGEPAHVPPTARERMYGLVQGKESEPHRRASRIGPPAFPGETESANELKEARRGVGYRLLGACVLGTALAVAVWQALPPRQTKTPPPPDQTADNSGQPEATPTPPEPPANPDVKPPDTNSKPPAPTPDKDKAAPPPPAPPPIAKPVDRSPNTERKDIGQFVSKDAVLLARDGEGLAKIAPDAKVRTVSALLALPGSHAELKLDSSAHLALWGGLPETTGWKTLDSQVTLFAPTAEFDLDFALDHGRVYISSTKKPGPAKVRVRFGDQIWDLTLADDQTEVAVEAVRLFAGEPFQRGGKTELPRTEVTLVVTQGKVGVKTGAKEFALQGPPGPSELVWNSKGPAIEKPMELDALPATWSKGALKPPDRQREIDAAQKKLVQRIGEKNKSIDLAIAEVAQDPSGPARALATLCRGALGPLTPLLEDLTDPQFSEVRRAAAVALAHTVARQPGADQQLFDQLKQSGDRQAEQFVTLLHGFSEQQLAEPGTYERWIEALRSDQVGIRELAAWRLRLADPEGAAIIRFGATDSEAAREKAIADWQRRIPPGKLPPARTNPQGKAPQKSPTRG